MSKECLKVKISRLNKRTAKIPTYGTIGAAGMDFYVDYLEYKVLEKKDDEWASSEKVYVPHYANDYTLEPMKSITVHTGIKIAIPEGLCMMLMPRSGLACKSGVTLRNSPGLIDSDYRGEIMIVLVNLGEEAVTIHQGDRVAQGVLTPYVKANFDEISADNLGITERNEGGFGSTGKR